MLKAFSAARLRALWRTLRFQRSDRRAGNFMTVWRRSLPLPLTEGGGAYKVLRGLLHVGVCVGGLRERKERVPPP